MTRPLKTIALAAAALCLSAPVLAQSSVSIYGTIDMSAGSFQDAGTPKTSKVESGYMATSFIGFTGAESLGGNLKAKFALETFLRADTGQSGRFNGDSFWARAAWVGLSGDFGTTSLGRTTNQFFISTLVFNAFADAFGYSPSIRQILTPGNGMLAFLGDTGWNNSLLYSSPDMGGLTFNLQGSLGEHNTAGGAFGNNVGANALYFHGPFAATVAYQQVKQGLSFAPALNPTPLVQSTGFQAQDSGIVGVSYDFGVVKLLGQISQEKTKATVTTKATTFGIGAVVPVGLGKVLAQYNQTKDDFAGFSPDLTNKTLTVGYDYSLSKRTDIYALALNDKLTGKSNGNTVAVGLRVSF